MRNAFADEVAKLCRADSRLMLLSGDIGNKLFDPFRQHAPDRFLNCGVAEANMIGVAAGLALNGLRPIVYTIAPFTTTRCFEQIRVDLCYHKAPVIIVGTGSGLSYAELGPTHHSLEDIAIMRTLPGMQVFAPADGNELRSCLRYALNGDHPTYIRIGKKGEKAIFEERYDQFRAGNWPVLQYGDRVAVISTGVMSHGSFQIVKQMEKTVGTVEMVHASSIKPLDESYLTSLDGRISTVISVEEHGLIGGLGAALAEWRSDVDALWRLRRIAARDEFMHVTGTTEYARSFYAIDGTRLSDEIQAGFAASRSGLRAA